MEQTTSTPLIGVDELDEARAADPHLVVLDVQWVLGRDDGRERWLEAHLPGARHVDLDRELAAPPSSTLGRHPLPDRADFQRLLRELGVHTESTIVVYDQSHSFGASRLWWLLGDAGLSSRVLDGGLAAWRRAGKPIATGEGPTPGPSAIEIDWAVRRRLTIDEAATLPDHGVLLDARAEARYRGETEPLDPRAGHIPGALSAPVTDNLDEHGGFLPPETLRDRFAALGVTDDVEVGAYCGSGIAAAHELLALEIAGLAGVLFPGSWSHWSRDADRPAAVGASAR